MILSKNWNDIELIWWKNDSWSCCPNDPPFPFFPLLFHKKIIYLLNIFFWNCCVSISLQRLCSFHSSPFSSHIPILSPVLPLSCSSHILFLYLHLINLGDLTNYSGKRRGIDAPVKEKKKRQKRRRDRIAGNNK